jgi:hypothetical protein
VTRLLTADTKRAVCATLDRVRAAERSDDDEYARCVEWEGLACDALDSDEFDDYAGAVRHAVLEEEDRLHQDV